jgi:hypothetical protein
MMVNAAVLTRSGETTEVESSPRTALQLSPGPSGSLVEYIGDRVVLDHEHMPIGDPITFRLRGHWTAAVKRRDGTLDFYRIP